MKTKEQILENITFTESKDFPKPMITLSHNNVCHIDLSAISQSSIKMKTFIDGKEYKPCTHTWQPIETAPKDGADIFLYFKSGNNDIDDFILVGHWSYHPYLDKLHNCFNIKIRIKNTYSCCIDEDIIHIDHYSYKGKITHWMPLPEPPEEK